MDAEANGVVVAENPTDQGTPLPGRAEAFKNLATEVLTTVNGAPEETKVADAPVVTPPEGEKPNALSQTESEKAETPGTEPEWNAEQQAWFAQMDAAKTPEEIAAAQKAAPTFSEAQLAWLKDQPEPTAETKPEAKAEDHLAEDQELKGKLDAKTQERINARIGKEVAKTKAISEKLTEVERQNQELQTLLAQRTASPNAKTGTPLEHVNDSAALKAVVTQAEQAQEDAENLLAQLDDNPAAVEQALRASKIELKDADGNEDYSPERMRRVLSTVQRNATKTLTKEVPKRMEFLKQVDAAAAEAVTIYPDLKDPKSEKRMAFDQIVAQAGPSIKQFPQWPKAIALMMLGAETAAKMNAAPAAPVQRSKRPVPVVIPTPRNAPPTPPVQTKVNGRDQSVVDAALNGDRKARLKHLQSLVS